MTFHSWGQTNLRLNANQEKWIEMVVFDVYDPYSASGFSVMKRFFDGVVECDGQLVRKRIRIKDRSYMAVLLSSWCDFFDQWPYVQSDGPGLDLSQRKNPCGRLTENEAESRNVETPPRDSVKNAKLANIEATRAGFRKPRMRYGYMSLAGSDSQNNLPPKEEIVPADLDAAQGAAFECMTCLSFAGPIFPQNVIQMMATPTLPDIENQEEFKPTVEGGRWITLTANCELAPLPTARHGKGRNASRGESWIRSTELLLSAITCSSGNW